MRKQEYNARPYTAYFIQKINDIKIIEKEYFAIHKYILHE